MTDTARAAMNTGGRWWLQRGGHGSIGRVQRQCLRATIARPGPLTTGELLSWCYPRLAEPPSVASVECSACCGAVHGAGRLARPGAAVGGQERRTGYPVTDRTPLKMRRKKHHVAGMSRAGR
jgi:hypothetical protein